MPASDEVALLTPEERLQWIRSGAEDPERLRKLLAALPDEPDPEESAAMVQLDIERLATDRRPAAAELALEIYTALLLREDGLAHQHVRQVFESDPERRAVAARAVARYAARNRRVTEDWQLLVRALNVAEGDGAREIIQVLRQFTHRATRPRWVRQVILHGLRLGAEGGDDALALAEHWTSQQLGDGQQPLDERLALWQAWFAEKYPHEPPAILPADSPGAKWQFEALRQYLASDEAWQADPVLGARAYEKAQCQKCHLFRGRGESLGPDLSDIRGRMSTHELLLAMLFPSEYVSDQYLTYTIVTRAGLTYTGVPVPSGGGAVAILQSNGEKVTLQREEIELSEPSSLSSMPSNTLDQLEREEIAALFAYLRSARYP